MLKSVLGIAEELRMLRTEPSELLTFQQFKRTKTARNCRDVKMLDPVSLREECARNAEIFKTKCFPSHQKSVRSLLGPTAFNISAVSSTVSKKTRNCRRNMLDPVSLCQKMCSKLLK